LQGSFDHWSSKGAPAEELLRQRVEKWVCNDATGIIVYKPVALCNDVKSMLAERLCRNYTSGMFGVPLSHETPAFVWRFIYLTQHLYDLAGTVLTVHYGPSPDITYTPTLKGLGPAMAHHY